MVELLFERAYITVITNTGKYFIFLVKRAIIMMFVLYLVVLFSVYGCDDPVSPQRSPLRVCSKSLKCFQDGWKVAYIKIHWLTAFLCLLCVQVDLFQLQVNTLRRYKRHYKLQTRPGLNKAQLAEVTTESMWRRCPLRDGCLVLCTVHVALSCHFVQQWNSET